MTNIDNEDNENMLSTQMQYKRRQAIDNYLQHFHRLQVFIEYYIVDTFGTHGLQLAEQQLRKKLWKQLGCGEHSYYIYNYLYTEMMNPSVIYNFIQDSEERLIQLCVEAQQKYDIDLYNMQMVLDMAGFSYLCDFIAY